MFLFGLNPLFPVVIHLFFLKLYLFYRTQTVFRLFLVTFDSNLLFMFFIKLPTPTIWFVPNPTTPLIPPTFNLVFPKPLSTTFWLRYGTAWQGTDLMHNHVLADTNLTVAGVPGNPPCSDQSEDSDYDSIWTAHSYRTASFSRKISVSQTGHTGETASGKCVFIITNFSPAVCLSVFRILSGYFCLHPRLS